MTDTDIETTIRRYLLFKKNVPSKENDEDIIFNKNLLIQYCKGFYFFSKKIVSSKIYNEDEVISKVIDNIKFIFLRQDTNIWNIGDNADEMYIIFLGKVNIYNPPEKKENNKKTIMKLDYTLEKGYSFGEDCLRYINTEKKRKFLAKSKTQCILGKLDAKDYNKIFKTIISEEKGLINTFLDEINIFGTDFNAKFQRCLTIKYIKKNEYIFKQGDNFDTFYLIYNGTIRLFSHLKKFVRSKIENNFFKTNNNNERFTTARQFEIKGSYNELINYNLIDVGKGDFIGGIEYLYNFENYKCSAKCLTDVVILKVDLSIFDGILIYAEKKIFKEKIEKQKEFISQRMKDIKSGRERLKINDYILSKNKFIKTFLQSNPLSKKIEEKLDNFINCNVNPIKIKQNNNNIKTLNNTKNLFPKYIEDYKNSKKGKKSWKKSNITIKDFVTNINYKKQVPVAHIFPTLISENIIPKNYRKIYIVKKEENNKVDKKMNTESYFDKSEYTLNKTRKVRSFSNRNIKNKLSLKKNVVFNNDNIRKQLYLNLKNTHSKKDFRFNRIIYKFNSFRK